MHVAGTSAGAAFQPEHMIAGGREGSTPTPDMVTMAPGLGLTNKFIVDQHFRERDRLGRLLTALAYNLSEESHDAVGAVAGLVQGHLAD